MRTTVTLDPDVVEQLKALARSRNLSFKAALNSAVRAGLAGERGDRRAYTVLPPDEQASRPGPDARLRMADELEDAEVLRKLELRK